MSTNAQWEQVTALSYASTTLEATHVHVTLATISMLITLLAMVSYNEICCIYQWFVCFSLYNNKTSVSLDDLLERSFNYVVFHIFLQYNGV